MDINRTLNELLVKLFRSINTIEERAMQTGEFKKITTNDMHVIEAIGTAGAKNMTTVAKSLNITTGTLTIAVNSLVKKGLVDRIRSDEDRRVVLVSLTEAGSRAHAHHKEFHNKMIQAVVAQLDEAEIMVLEKSLNKLNTFFKEM
ncbi:MAG: MarR family transcriptional regulator [Eubacteriales bacterium]